MCKIKAVNNSQESRHSSQYLNRALTGNLREKKEKNWA